MFFTSAQSPIKIVVVFVPFNLSYLKVAKCGNNIRNTLISIKLVVASRK